MAKVMIIGLGNLLMGDEGAGVHLIKELENTQLPPEVELLDGGVNSFAALAQAHGAQRIIIVDAMLGGGQPGDIYRLEDKDLDSQLTGVAWSAHDFSLAHSLAAYQKIAALPPITIYGVEPAVIALSMELSPPVQAAVGKIVSLINRDIEIFRAKEGLMNF